MASELGRTLEAPWPGLEEIVAFLLQVHHLLSQPDLYLWLEVSTSQGDESGDRSCYASNLISICKFSQISQFSDQIHNVSIFYIES